MKREKIKRFVDAIDDQFNLNLLDGIRKIEKFWYNLFPLTLIRSILDPILIALKYKLKIGKNKPIRLHLGCGNRKFKGYDNIDQRRTKATDYICDIRKLPYPENSVEVIECYHVIEHLPRHDLLRTLKDFYKILKLNGKLVIECPDFDEVVKEYLKGNEKRLDNIFGRQRYKGDVHYFGYNFKRLKRILKNVGFRKIQKKKPVDHHTKTQPCLRVEAIK